MLRQMERSAIKVLAKRGKSVRQIAAELDQPPGRRRPADRRQRLLGQQHVRLRQVQTSAGYSDGSSKTDQYGRGAEPNGDLLDHEHDQ